MANDDEAAGVETDPENEEGPGMGGEEGPGMEGEEGPEMGSEEGPGTGCEGRPIGGSEEGPGGGSMYHSAAVLGILSVEGKAMAVGVLSWNRRSTSSYVTLSGCERVRKDGEPLQYLAGALVKPIKSDEQKLVKSTSST